MTTPKRNLQQEIGLQKPLDFPEQEAYLNLVRTCSALQGDFASLFKSHGLSEPQYNALRIIVGAGRDGIRTEQVGARMVARDPDTTRLIDRLVKAGLVERRRLAEDRRCVVVHATADGKATIRRLHEPVDALHHAQLGHMTRADLKALNALLVTARHP